MHAGESSINAGNLSNSLINNNSQHIVTITHIGAETNKNAVLTITYDQNSSLSVNILVGSGTVNQPPNAVASATPTNGTFPLEVFFTGSSSSDDNGEYQHICGTLMMAQLPMKLIRPILLTKTVFIMCL